MPIARQEVEARIAEQKRIAKERKENFLASEEGKSFLAAVTPIKDKILKTLAHDPEQLHTVGDLVELFWTISPPPPEPQPGESREEYRARLTAMPPPEPKDANHPVFTQEHAQGLDAAISMLVEEKSIVVYQYAHQEYCFGAAKKESPMLKTCACDRSDNKACLCNGSCNKDCACDGACI